MFTSRFLIPSAFLIQPWYSMCHCSTRRFYTRIPIWIKLLFLFLYIIFLTFLKRQNFKTFLCFLIPAEHTFSTGDLLITQLVLWKWFCRGTRSPWIFDRMIWQRDCHLCFSEILIKTLFFLYLRILIVKCFSAAAFQASMRSLSKHGFSAFPVKTGRVDVQQMPCCFFFK